MLGLPYLLGSFPMFVWPVAVFPVFSECSTLPLLSNNIRGVVWIDKAAQIASRTS